MQYKNRCITTYCQKYIYFLILFNSFCCISNL